MEDVGDHIATREEMSKSAQRAWDNTGIITQISLSFQTFIRPLGGIINQDLTRLFYQHIMLSRLQSQGCRLDGGSEMLISF